MRVHLVSSSRHPRCGANELRSSLRYCPRCYRTSAPSPLTMSADWSSTYAGPVRTTIGWRSHFTSGVERSAECEDLHGVRLAADLSLAERTRFDAIVAEVSSRDTREGRVDLVFLRERLHARRCVHRITDGGVVRALGESDRAQHDITGVHPHAELHHWFADPRALDVQRRDAPADRERRTGGSRCAMCRVAHRAEDRHEAVAGELVKDPAGIDDGSRHEAEISVHDGDHLLRRELVRERRRAAEIGEEDR